MKIPKKVKLKLWRKYRYYAYYHATIYSSHIMFKTDPATDIKDLYQEGMLGIWESLETYDPGLGNFESYARNAAENYIRNYIATKTRKLIVNRNKPFEGPFNMYRLEDTDILETLPDDYDIELDVGKQQMMTYITDALWDLEEEDRELLSMAFGLDRKAPMDNTKIAKELGISTKTVQRRMPMALDRFKNALVEYVDEEDIDEYSSTPF